MTVPKSWFMELMVEVSGDLCYLPPWIHQVCWRAVSILPTIPMPCPATEQQTEGASNDHKMPGRTQPYSSRTSDFSLSVSWATEGGTGRTMEAGKAAAGPNLTTGYLKLSQHSCLTSGQVLLRNKVWHQSHGKKKQKNKTKL